MIDNYTDKRSLKSPEFSYSGFYSQFKNMI